MPRKKRAASPFELMDDDFDDNSSQSSRNGNPPIQRNAANARERARMRVLSSAFGRLKTKLPNIPADTKLSKLDTLRLATMYIKQLKAVVEGGADNGLTTTNGEIIEASTNHNGSATNCYLNLNTSVQSMNWPFGFHHHLSNSSLIRTSSANNLINNNSPPNNSTNNWCLNNNNNNEEHIKHTRYDTENYEHHQPPTSDSYLHLNTSLNLQNNHNSLNNNHWYSETPSPELETTYENSHSQQQQQQQHQPEHSHHHLSHLQNNQQQQHHLQNMTHLTPLTTAAATHSSTTFHLQHDFHHQQHHLPPPHHHMQHANRFVNATNFQSTSIR
ncbi:basic helix-loop-helix domain-containing transcription factor HLH54F [Cochliomyia hominivorax]